MAPARARPNWFVAAPVPPDDWFDRLVTLPPSGLRRFHPDDLHLTIAFLGAVGEAAARRAFAALRWPAGAARVTLGAVVPMGSNRRYSALSALLDDGRQRVEGAIAATRDIVCTAAGARLEHRPAKAHLTLARPHRRATPAERDDGLAWARGLSLAGVGLVLTRVALYTWAEDRAEDPDQDRRAPRFRMTAVRSV